jgi:hypothetical protein
MKEPKTLAEWLESRGNPKHAIAEGTDGSMVIAIEDKSSFGQVVTVYNYRETDLPSGKKTFWISSGWGIQKEYFSILKALLTDIGGEA